MKAELMNAATIILSAAVLLGIPIVLFYGIRYLIWYNADCKYRYNQYSQAQRELDRLEEDINAHKDYDWTKEPETVTSTTTTRPGSAAHYEAWKAEQMNKNKSRE